MILKKLNFQAAWDSSTIFFVDEELEDEIDQKVAELVNLSENPHLQTDKPNTPEDIFAFLRDDVEGINVILRDIGLSYEKFMRMVSLLRQTERVPGGFEQEWSMKKIKDEILKNDSFATTIVDLLLNGSKDETLQTYVPRYYLEKLNYREISTMPAALRRLRYKEAQIGTYGGKKGYKVEEKISKHLEKIKQKHGISYEQGTSRIVNVDLDFAIPSLEDPWVIIMSSFQETTSSGQSTKARDMRAAYALIQQSNSRHKEKRIFVNFVDGGGWLARKRDFERLVSECHYFINLNNLNLIEKIILEHTPKKYFSK